jgi:hypothetical protein
MLITLEGKANDTNPFGHFLALSTLTYGRDISPKGYYQLHMFLRQYISGISLLVKILRMKFHSLKNRYLFLW